MTALLCLINHRNISTLVAAKALSPERIYLLHSGSDEDLEDLENVTMFFSNLYPEMEVISYQMEFYDCKKLRAGVQELMQKESDVMLDLSNGHPVAAMLLREIALEFEIPIFVFSERDERAIIIDKGECISIEIEDVDLQVEDFVESGGGSVYAQSTEIFESQAIKHLLKWQISHHDLWMRINRALKTKAIMRTLDQHQKNNLVVLSTQRLNKKEHGLVLEYLVQLHTCRIAKFKKTSKFEYLLSFHKDSYKRYIMGYGFWLEAVTFYGMKKLAFLDDVKGGVSFFWDDKQQRVNNEIDVLAVYREKLVLVSCKDSSKYSEKDLNELIVSAEGLGGDNAIRIMVVTQWPDKSSVKVRASELGVHLIRYDGKLEAFVQELEAVLKKERP